MNLLFYQRNFRSMLKTGNVKKKKNKKIKNKKIKCWSLNFNRNLARVHIDFTSISNFRNPVVC